jgi:hypothetical protein
MQKIGNHYYFSFLAVVLVALLGVRMVDGVMDVGQFHAFALLPQEGTDSVDL